MDIAKSGPVKHNNTIHQMQTQRRPRLSPTDTLPIPTQVPTATKAVAGIGHRPQRNMRL